MTELFALLQNLTSESVSVEALVLALCLLLALGVTKLVFKGTTALMGETSVWFGPRFFDGLMFPLLALVLSYAAREVWIQTLHEALFRIAIPILLSLVVIRLMARVLSSVFPDSLGIQVLERGVSYFVWLIAVLWITGFLPWVTKELESIHISFGRTKIDLLSLIEGVLSSCLVLVLSLLAM